MARLTRRRPTAATTVTRAQFTRVRREIQRLSKRYDEALTTLREVEHACDIQFRRIAQLQAEVDQLRKIVKP